MTKCRHWAGQEAVTPLSSSLPIPTNPLSSLVDMSAPCSKSWHCFTVVLPLRLVLLSWASQLRPVLHRERQAGDTQDVLFLPLWSSSGTQGHEHSTAYPQKYASCDPQRNVIFFLNSGNHVFDVFVTIPLIPLQSLSRAGPPQ
jgi:hypothetical protein